MPALSITLAHFSISAFSRSKISSGVLAFASMPSSINRFLMSASANIPRNASFSVLMISGGVPLGANSAFQETTS